MTKLNIVLLGKTGHGKSATGNTILQENRFLISPKATSFTKIIERGTKVIGEYKVQVFDTPGPYDTGHGNNGRADISKTCPLLESMIAASVEDGGVHAFFLVLTVGTKLTQEEMLTIEILEDIFGSRVFLDFGVLVFTHGENLEGDLSKWCADQDDKFKKLMAKFNNRVLITINTGEFSGRRSQFSENMVEAAADLKKSKKVYNLDNYKKSERPRTQLVVKSKKNELMEKFLEKINTLENDINRFKSMNPQNLTLFLGKINELRGEIKNASQGTDVLDDLHVYVDNLKFVVESKIARCSVL